MNRSFAMLACAITPLGAQVREIAWPATPLGKIAEPFTRIPDVRELPDGRVVVLDAGEIQVAVVDFARGTRQPIGRRGSGPGEYQRPSRLFALDGNRTWMMDGGKYTVHEIAPDGRIAASTLLNDEGPVSGTTLLLSKSVDGKGRFYFESDGNAPDGEPHRVPVLRWDRDAKKLDTLATVTSSVIFSANGPAKPRPYRAVEAWAALPDGRLVVVRPEPFRVDIVDRSGVLRQGAPTAYTPIPVAAREREAYRERLSSRRSGRGTTTPSAPAPATRNPALEVRDEDFPKALPPFTGMVLAPDGEIWVRMSAAATDSTARYNVFDDTGTLVARVALPPHSSVVGFGASGAYVTWQNPTDDLLYLQKFTRPKIGAR